MKKYFVTSDVHSAYSELMEALRKKGFDIDNENHILIICGDLFDRMNETVQCYEFAQKMAELNRLIYVRGNHENLLFECVDEIRKGYSLGYHHYSNGTIKSMAQLCGEVSEWIFYDPDKRATIYPKIKPVLDFITNNTVNYFELGDYIFVHSWVPVFNHLSNFRDADQIDWNAAMWGNPYEMAELTHTKLEGKTVVFGHFHTSWPREHFHGEPEWGDGANFDVYYGNGYIALDACVAYSGYLNCIVFEEDDNGVVKLLDKPKNI